MLSAIGVTRRFGSRVAVENLSFDVAPGEIFALLGPNGAGKTTTLRMLAGLIEPSSGAVRIDSDTLSRVNASRLRSRIGFLTETPGLWDRLSVWKNLLVYAELQGLADPEAAVADALATFDLRGRASDPAAQLSKGLRQRVALARTLLHKPDIVLLDEPTAGLDPESAREVRELVLKLRADLRSVVVSTHNLDEVERIADRVAVIRTALIAVDTPAALRARVFGSRVRVILTQPAKPFVGMLTGAGFSDIRHDGAALSIGLVDYTGSVPALVRRLVDAGAEILTVAAEEPPLEDVYLKLVGASPS